MTKQEVRKLLEDAKSSDNPHRQMVVLMRAMDGTEPGEARPTEGWFHENRTQFQGEFINWLHDEGDVTDVFVDRVYSFILNKE
jgi:hypothetical protein